MPTQLEIGQLKQILQDREAVLRARVRKAIHERAGRDNSELEASGGDDSEQSIADLLEGVDTEIMSREGEELLAIEAAMGRMRTGGYGHCIACHGAISFSRLLAVPTAQRCQSCQQHLELTHGGHAEPTL